MGRLLTRSSDRRPRDDAASQDERIHGYLTEGRIRILEVTEDSIRAVCRGLRGVYRMSWDAEDGWRCSCGSSGSCSHLSALQLVTAPA